VPNLRLNSRPGPLPAALAACGLLGLVSLAASIEPLYDPWAWWVWGRELADFDLDTSAGPSWKPLPVLLAAPLSAFDGAAPELWLALGRAGWLAVPVLAWRLAARLEGTDGRRPLVAGALAALAVVVLSDDVTPWPRQGAGGLSEPLLTAFVLGAIDAALAARPRLSLALALAACLLRPEAWPFALAYAWSGARAGRIARGVPLAGAALVAALWFIPDLLGAGNALEGAGRARGADNSPLEVVGWAAAMPLAVIWAGVVLALWPWRARAPRPAALLAASAGAWIALVAVMAAAGYAGIPRFMAPAIAVLCVVGAIGLVRAVGALAPQRALAAAAIVTAGLGVQSAVRLADVPRELEQVSDDSIALERLEELAGSEREAFVGCGELWTSVFGAQTALAWHLELPIREVVPTGTVPPPDGRLLVGEDTRPSLARRIRAQGPPLAAAEGWAVYGTGSCAP
jgi:hypothetical protein